MPDIRSFFSAPLKKKASNDNAGEKAAHKPSEKSKKKSSVLTATTSPYFAGGDPQKSPAKQGKKKRKIASDDESEEESVSQAELQIQAEKKATPIKKKKTSSKPAAPVSMDASQFFSSFNGGDQASPSTPSSSSLATTSNKKPAVSSTPPPPLEMPTPPTKTKDDEALRLKKERETEDSSLALALQLQEEEDKEAARNRKRKQEEAKSSQAPKRAASTSSTSSPATAKKSSPVSKQEAQTDQPEKPVKKQADEAAPPVKRKNTWYPGKIASAPPLKGQKPLPTGPSMCLNGLTFVLSGTQESLEKEEVQDLIKKYGGRITGSVSGKTNYLVRGIDAGEVKLEKAKASKICQIIDEDGLFDLITNGKEGGVSTPAKKKSSSAKKKSPASATLSSPPPKPSFSQASSSSSSSSSSSAGPSSAQASAAGTNLWVDRHKPSHVDHIIGNRENVNRIKNYLSAFHNKFLRKGKENKAGKKAVLLFGPPGVGKSTAATLVAQSMGYDVLEFNASDVRNKASLEDEVGQLTNSRSVGEFFGRSGGGGKASSGKKVLVMDEVDGMSGNADRGGIQTLIDVIKNSKIPIICICNDGSHPKIRSLKNHCEALMWRRPTKEQIAPRMLAIARREGLRVDEPAIKEVVEMVRGDIRQVINLLQMWQTNETHITFDKVKEKMKNAGKDFDYGPFDVFASFFQPPPSKPDWLNDRLNNFFVDSDLLPLFVHENYLAATPVLQPEVKKNKATPMDVLHMDALSEAADYITDGDLLSVSVRRDQNWALMPLMGAVGCVAAGISVAGRPPPPQFPAWLGKNSTTGKNLRLLQEICTVLAIDSTCNRQDMALFYHPLLRIKLLLPLCREGKEGVEEVVQIMSSLSLTRDDWGNISALGENFSPLKNSQIDSQVKAAFTRALNKEEVLLKVARPSDKKFTAKKLKGESLMVNNDDDDDDDEAEGEDSDDVTKDKSIVQMKVPGKKTKGKTEKKKSSTKKPAKKKK